MYILARCLPVCACVRVCVCACVCVPCTHNSTNDTQVLLYCRCFKFLHICTTDLFVCLFVVVVVVVVVVVFFLPKAHEQASHLCTPTPTRPQVAGGSALQRRHQVFPAHLGSVGSEKKRVNDVCVHCGIFFFQIVYQLFFCCSE